jgi:hypothetical protein
MSAFQAARMDSMRETDAAQDCRFGFERQVELDNAKRVIPILLLTAGARRPK